MTFFIRIALAPLCLALAACGAGTYVPRDESALRPAPVGPLLIADPAPGVPSVALVPEPAIEGYDVYRWTMPASGENGQADNVVTARYFRARRPGPRPLAVIVPLWGTFTFPGENVAEGLRQLSGGEYDVLLFRADAFLVDWDEVALSRDEAELRDGLKLFRVRMESWVKDTRRALDWAETRGDIDMDRLALVGMSKGAIVAAVTAAHEPRFTANAFILGGARLPEIVTSCGGNAKVVREGARENAGLSLEALLGAVEEELFSLEPARYAGHYDPRSILVVEAAADRCMSGVVREDFHAALGYPARVVYRNAGHSTTFLALMDVGGNTLQSHLHRFFEERFATAR